MKVIVIYVFPSLKHVFISYTRFELVTTTIDSPIQDYYQSLCFNARQFHFDVVTKVIFIDEFIYICISRVPFDVNLFAISSDMLSSINNISFNKTHEPKLGVHAYCPYVWTLILNFKCGCVWVGFIPLSIQIYISITNYSGNDIFVYK